MTAQIDSPPRVDYGPRCWKCNKKLAESVARPWVIRCVRCKARNASAIGDWEIAAAPDSVALMPNPPLILRRRDVCDDWHFQPGCPRWPKDKAAFEEMPAAQLKRSRGTVCEHCVRIAGTHRGRGGWH